MIVQELTLCALVCALIQVRLTSIVNVFNRDHGKLDAVLLLGYEKCVIRSLLIAIWHSGIIYFVLLRFCALT